MLKQQFRLRSPRGFRQTLAGKKLCANRWFSVFALPRKDPSAATRFGFIVSRKVDKRATRRNRIKRRLREIIRTRVLPYPQMLESIRPYEAIVFIARTDSVNASYEEIERALLKCLGGPNASTPGSSGPVRPEGTA